MRVIKTINLIYNSKIKTMLFQINELALKCEIIMKSLKINFDALSLKG